MYTSYSSVFHTAKAYLHLHGESGAYEVSLENKYHNDVMNSLYFSLGASSGYSVNGIYAGLTFNYQTGAHL
jgi:hypothetical protein